MRLLSRPPGRRRLASFALAVACLLGAGLLGACSEDAPGVDHRDAKAERVWEQFVREDPKTQLTFELCLRENGFAAKRHANDSDRDGVRYQVRGIEAQSIYAVQEQDAELASVVADRIDELADADFLTNFEDVLPGARQRLEDARKRVSPLAD
jgi:hypothetical protein